MIANLQVDPHVKDGKTVYRNDSRNGDNGTWNDFKALPVVAKKDGWLYAESPDSKWDIRLKDGGFAGTMTVKRGNRSRSMAPNCQVGGKFADPGSKSK